MTLGQKIRAARIEQGLTQRQLVGEFITRNMLSKIENDSATPSMRTLEYLAEKLGMSPAYFVGDDQYSNGSSPDGLDDMRLAYREGRYMDCISLLEASRRVATTDEGYLLRARASLAAAKNALAAGDITQAKELADAADYYNKEGMYYSAETDAEMSLVLAECVLELDISEFEQNAKEYERAVKNISFDTRFTLAKAEYLRRTGEPELALKSLASISGAPEEFLPKIHCITGLTLLDEGKINEAVAELSQAERISKDEKLNETIFASLEEAYVKMENFKMAHQYASRRLKE